MKKSILIGALAALMLFAFVACDNSTPVNKTIEGLEVTTTKTDYLVNQTFDPSTVSVLVRYTDGTTAPVNASLSVDGVTDGKLATAQQYKVTATYGYVISDGYFGQSVGEKQATGTTYINVYNIDSIAVTKLPEVVSYEEGTAKAKIDLAGIEVTATYNGASKMVLAEGEYVVKSPDAIPSYSDAAEATNTTKITVEEALTSGSAATKQTADFEVAVTKKAPTAEKPLTGPVTSLTITKGANFPSKVFYQDSVNDIEDNIVVKASDGSNTITLTKDQYRVVWGNGVTNRQFVVAGTSDETTGESVSFYVTYVADPTVPAATDTVSVLNYVKALTVAPAEIIDVTKGDSATNVKSTKTITVTGTLAYDSTPADETAATTSVTAWNYQNPVITLAEEPIVYKNAKGDIISGVVKVKFAD